MPGLICLDQDAWLAGLAEPAGYTRISTPGLERWVGTMGLERWGWYAGICRAKESVSCQCRVSMSVSLCPFGYVSFNLSVFFCQFGYVRAEADEIAVAVKAKAEAEQMTKKAAAWKEYRDAAMVDMMMDTLPKIVAEVATPLISSESGNVGASNLITEVIDIASRLSQVVRKLTGVNISKAFTPASFIKKAHICQIKRRVWPKSPLGDASGDLGHTRLINTILSLSLHPADPGKYSVCIWINHHYSMKSEYSCQFLIVAKRRHFKSPHQPNLRFTRNNKT
uniref:Uncharacterized protein n=1 Tax=Strigamia maritima TaxID=126957 RepID=T1JGG8_STRMM